MTLLVPNASAALMLKNILNNTAPQQQTLKLFTNNYTPVEASVAGDFTEAAGSGYASIGLIGANWGFTTADPAVALYNAEQVFTFTGALGNVYGYFIVQAVSGLLLYAERFTNAPFNVQNNGDQIKFTPTLTLD